MLNCSPIDSGNVNSEQTTHPPRVISQWRGNCEGWLRGLLGSSTNMQCFWQLVRTEFGSRSHSKQTAAEFIWNQTEATPSTRSPFACLVHFWCSPEYNCCIYTCTNQPHHTGGNALKFDSSILNMAGVINNQSVV